MIFTGDRSEYHPSRLPEHPCLRLVTNSEQILTTHSSRRLITMEKIMEPEVSFSTSIFSEFLLDSLDFFWGFFRVLFDAFDSIILRIFWNLRFFGFFYVIFLCIERSWFVNVEDLLNGGIDLFFKKILKKIIWRVLVELQLNFLLWIIGFVQEAVDSAVIHDLQYTFRTKFFERCQNSTRQRGEQYVKQIMKRSKRGNGITEEEPTEISNQSIQWTLNYFSA